jgi:antitoxin (DNA-binding transcriptional repressor) of toxin-antitoxin stability system
MKVFIGVDPHKLSVTIEVVDDGEAVRLLADGEHVVDVPAKLAARARLFDTGHTRKTHAHDAHAPPRPRRLRGWRRQLLVVVPGHLDADLDASRSRDQFGDSRQATVLSRHRRPRRPSTMSNHG